MTIATMMQTLRAQVFTLAEEPVDGAAAADFSEGFEADTAGAGVGFIPAEEGAEATIIAEAETTGGTGGTGGTLPTVGDSQTGFGGGVSARANSNPEMMLFYEPLCSFFLANSPSKWGHDLFDEISKDEDVPAKESKEVESADVTTMDE